MFELRTIPYLVTIPVLCVFSTSFVFATDASVTLFSSFEGQTIRAFSSLSDLDNNTSPIFTTVTDTNLESIYNYNTDTNTTLYFKAEISSTHPTWGISSYILQSGTDNVLYLWVGWSLWSVISGIEDIKWPGFITDTHSLASQTWALSSADKNDIADRTRDRIVSPGGILDQIFDLVSEIFTRIFSIKSDTQKIR